MRVNQITQTLVVQRTARVNANAEQLSNAVALPQSVTKRTTQPRARPVIPAFAHNHYPTVFQQGRLMPEHVNVELRQPVEQPIKPGIDVPQMIV